MKLPRQIDLKLPRVGEMVVTWTNLNKISYVASADVRSILRDMTFIRNYYLKNDLDNIFTEKIRGD
jgi:hypothetical protein